MKDLLQSEYTPTAPNEQPLASAQLSELAETLGNEWQVVDNHHLTKRFEFPNFQTALDFVNQVGEYSENVNHHPEITFTWGRVDIEIYTHSIDGLRKEDFIWAANIETLFQNS